MRPEVELGAVTFEIGYIVDNGQKIRVLVRVGLIVAKVGEGGEIFRGYKLHHQIRA